MNAYANSLKNMLTSLISEMSAAPSPMSKTLRKFLLERRSGFLRRSCNS